MKSNKFNASWQLARVQAKNIKDVDKKIEFIMNYYNENMTAQDKMRVLNWLKMTKVAYTGDIRDKFDDPIELVQILKTTVNDNDTTLDDLTYKEVELIYKDLSKRKYGFQFKSVPKAHIEFMEQLEQKLNKE